MRRYSEYYEKLHYMTFKRDILEASEEFILFLFIYYFFILLF